MIPTVYIHCNDGIPVTRNVYDCYIGFKVRGHPIIKFEIKTLTFADETVESNEVLNKITKNDILCTGFPVFRKVIKFLGIDHEDLETYPKVLKEFYGRTIQETTLLELQNKFEAGNISEIFLKPKKTKLFTGFVARRGMDFLKIAHIDDKTEIYTSTTVGFISEYRVYVNQNNHFTENGIIGCSLYNGDALTFPDPKRIKEIVTHYNKNGAPVAYAVDVGVIKRAKKLETIVIEVNDATCLGNYGIPATLYAQMIEERWKQLTNV